MTRPMRSSPSKRNTVVSQPQVFSIRLSDLPCMTYNPRIACMAQYFDPILFGQNSAPQQRSVSKETKVVLRLIGAQGDEALSFSDPLNFLQALNGIGQVQGINWSNGNNEIKLSIGKKAR